MNEPSLELQERSTKLDLKCLYDLIDQFAPKKQGKIQPKFFLRKDVMLRLFVSLAPILADWKKNILDPEKHEFDEGIGENYTFIGATPYATEAKLLASCAFYLASIRTRRSTFSAKNDNEYDIMRSAPTVRKLAAVMKPYVTQYLDLNTFPDIERFLYELSARILVVAYLDLDTYMDGFFAVLLSSVFARPMSPDAREQWEEYLGLAHKLEKGTPEYLNPFISIHSAVLAYSEKWGTLNMKQYDGKAMKITESAATSFVRVSDLQDGLHAEADYDPELLTAFDSTAPPLPPNKVPSRIISTKQAQPRGNGAKATELDGGAASKTKAPEATPKLPAQTHTATDASTSLEKIATLESSTHGIASEKKRKTAAAAPDPSNPDPPAHNKKQDRKADVATGSESEPQGDVISAQPGAATDPQENEEDVAITIVDADEVPQPKATPTPAPPPPVQDKRFFTVNGRIVPSGRRTAPAVYERWTGKEQLALYTKYMEVAMRQRQQFGNQISAKQWYELWEEVALFIPGRGVLDLIEFYIDNKEEFSF